MKFQLRIAALLVALLQSACAPTLPAGPTPIRDIGFHAGRGGANAAARPRATDLQEISWWHVFGDPGLSRLVEIALKDNPGLAEAGARVRLAQAALLRASATEWPHLDSIGEITRAHISRNGNHGIYNGATSTVGVIAPLAVNYHLDVFGEDRENIAAVRAGAEAVRAQYRQSALLLSSAVIKTYFALNIARQLVEIQTAIVTLTKSAERTQAAAYEAGIQSAVNTLSTQVEIQQAERALAAMQQRKAALGFALAHLLGKGPADRIPVATVIQVIPEKLKIPTEINMDILARRPDIQAALWNIRHAAHLEKSAQAAFYPNINLRALAGFNSIGISSLFKASSIFYAFGPAVSLPIFEGGALEGRLQARESAYDIAVFTYNKMILSAASEVATDLAALEHSRERMDEQADVVHQRSVLVDVAASRFNSGITDRIPFIQARVRYDNAIEARLEETLNWLAVLTDTATAVGGGFQKWPA